MMEEKSNKKVFVKGLNGCCMRRTNIRQYCDFFKANEYELVKYPEESDFIFLWTCGFRQDFKENSISEIKRYQREYDAELVVGGCLPSIDGIAFKDYFKGKTIVWKNDGEDIKKYFEAKNKKLSDIQINYGEDSLCDDLEKYKKENPDKAASFADQFLKVFTTEGCKFECSYCSERLAFPPFYSFPEEKIVESCRKLVEKTGKLEVMLLGDSVGEYGSDIGSNLPTLIKKIKKIDLRLKIALQGLNPAHFIKFYEEISDLLNKKHIQHLQLPIQSASNRILGLMKRPYTKRDLNKIFSLFNNLNFRDFETHIIVGFPSETEKDYEETIQFILEQQPRYVLASGFMESQTMEAAKLPGKINDEIKTQRLKNTKLKLEEEGIICNTDNSELSQERFRTLNLNKNIK